jgi:hypothetical protein
MDNFNMAFDHWLDASIETHIYNCDDHEELENYVTDDIEDFADTMKDHMYSMSGIRAVDLFIKYQQEFERYAEEAGYDNHDKIFDPIPNLIKIKVELVDWEAKYQLYKEESESEEEEEPQQ